MEIPWHRFASPWWHACDILRWNKGLRCSAFIFMYSILWKFSSTPFQFPLIIFCLDICRLCSTLTRLSKGCPELGTITFDHVKIFKFIFSVRSSKCAWLGGVCGCLSFYERFPDVLYIKLGAIPSNVLHHIVLECGKMKKICWFWYLITSVCALFSSFMLSNSRYIQSREHHYSVNSFFGGMTFLFDWCGCLYHFHLLKSLLN